LFFPDNECRNLEQIECINVSMQRIWSNKISRSNQMHFYCVVCVWWEIKNNIFFKHPNIWIRFVSKSIVGGNQMPITIKSIIQSIFMIWNYNVQNVSSLLNVLKRYPILSSTWTFSMVRTLYNLCWSYTISSSFLICIKPNQ
jgi:hypothetical protein